MKLKKGLHPQTLRKNGFNRRYGEYEWNRVTPLYSYKNNPIIVLKIEIDTEEKTFNYYVYDNNTSSVYTPYYSGSPIPNYVLDEVNTKVSFELNKLVKAGVIVE